MKGRPRPKDGVFLKRLVALAAGAASAVSGLGLGSILTPLLMVSFPTSSAVAIVAIPHAVATTVRWWRPRADVDRAAFRSGGFGGLVWNQGGIRAAALLDFNLPPRALVATATTSSLFVDATRVPVHVVTSGLAGVER